MADKMNPSIAAVLARLGADLQDLNTHEPYAMARVAALIDHTECSHAVTDLLLAVMPATVDDAQWISWIQGGAPPAPCSLRNPDANGRPHARGAMQAAQGKRDAAAERVAQLEAQLGEAQRELAAAEAILRQASDRVRIVVAYRILVEIGRQASALSLGPLYAVARAISPYLQHDAVFEAGLDPAGRDLLAERRETREKDSREILDRLDRYAGEPELELKLHRAVRKVVRDFHQQREAENEAAKQAGKPLPDHCKRRTIRRSAEAQQAGVHPAAPRADVADVFDAYATATMGADDAVAAPQ